MDADWIAVAESSELADDAAREIVIEQKIIAIFRHRGQLHALDGMCAHQGGPIAEGKIEAGCVTCPWHGWQYELDTGIQTINRQPLQQTFEIRERDGKIEIKIPAEA